ncbi:MAG: TRAP transporter small permease [Lachnoclostridium edouardi]|uniref:TRAP transporter small permease n=1 Tax=Lachnoclostridium edouardi TaxID=1926283 RepID=UPI0026DD0097|nr:TRAP transporter small permease [Lachnoclostridium edouardi]MDO4277323.1 TRAP transporter small permease [Lachnoclostridium edouardi]
MIVKIADKIKFILRSLSCITICTLVIVTGLQVVNRYVFHKSFTWVEELGGMAMVYITYFGAAMATINNSNTRIDFFIHKLPRPICQAFEILDDCICIGFLGVISCLSWKLAGSNMNALSAAMKIPLAVNYIGILLGCILMIGFYFIHLWVDIQKCKGLDMSSIEEALNR